MILVICLICSIKLLSCLNYDLYDLSDLYDSCDLFNTNLSPTAESPALWDSAGIHTLRQSPGKSARDSAVV